MKTTYLDNEITLLERYKKDGEASFYQLRKLAEYRKIKQLLIHSVVDSEANLPLMNSCDMASDPRDCNRKNQCYYCQK